LISLGELIVEREAQETLAELLGHRATARLPTMLSAHFRKMERQVMENAEDSALFEVSDERLTKL
jgi:hypothetical protein